MLTKIFRVARVPIVALVILVGASGAASAAFAATPVVASGQAVNSSVFVAGALAALTSSTDGPLNLVTNRVLQRVYELQPTLAPATAVSDIHALVAAYHAGAPSALTLAVQTPNQRIIGVLRVLDANPPGGVVRTALQAVAQSALEASANSALAGADFTPSASSMATLERGALEPGQVLADAHEEARLDSAFGQAWNSLWSSTAHQSIVATTSQLLASNPALQGPDVRQVAGMIGSDGSLSSTVQALTAVANPDFGQLHGVTKAAATPGESSSQAAQNAQTIRDAQAGLSLLSSLIGLGDGSAGNVIGQMDNTMSGMATLFNDWSSGNLAGGVLSGLSAFATAYLTGNVIGEVTSLSNLFGGLFGGGQSSQQALEQQIGALKSDLDHFERVTAARFKALDQELRSIYARLSQELGALAQEIQNDFIHIQADFTVVYGDLRKLALQIDRLQTNLYIAIKDAQNRDLWGDPNAGINIVMNYQNANATGQPMANSQFQGADGFFYTWATQSAFDSIALGPSLSQSDFAPDAVLPRLDLGLESNLDYVNFFPGYALSTTPPTLVPGSSLSQNPPPLPNPHDWAVTAQAYAELLLENPNYVTGTQTGRLQQIAQEGKALKCAFANISGINPCPSNTPLGKVLFTALSNNFVNWGSGNPGSVAQGISRVEGDFLSAQPTTANVQNIGGPANLAGLNLWGGPEQATYTTTRTVSGCGTDGTDNSPPTNFTPSAVVANAFELATELGVGTDLQLSCQSHWTNPYVDHEECPDPNYPCIIYWDAHRYLQLDWDMTTPSGTIHIVTGEYTNPNGEPVCSNLDNQPPCVNEGDTAYVNASWQTGFQQYATIQDGGNTPTVEGLDNSALVALQKQLYGYVVAGNGPNGSLGQPSSPLGQAVARLQGAAGAIDAYAQIGLAPALANDDKLRALLLSSGHLLNRSSLLGMLEGMYTNAAKSPPATDELTRVQSQITRDASALHTEVGRVLAATGFDESNPLVGSTLDRLSLTGDVLGWFHPGGGPATVGSISGTILTKSAAAPPLRGICVQARTPRSGAAVQSTITDSRGDYTLFGLPVGTYDVYMYDCTNGYALAQYYGGGTTPAAATPVRVSPGQTTALINQLATELVLGGKITGIVTNNASTPVPIGNACVLALNASTGVVVETANSAANGTYALPTLKPGSYKVKFTDCGRGKYVTQYFSNASTFAAAATVTVSAGSPVTHVSAKLVPVR